jgi:hypothetical protein
MWAHVPSIESRAIPVDIAYINFITFRIMQKVSKSVV